MGIKSRNVGREFERMLNDYHGIMAACGHALIEQNPTGSRHVGRRKVIQVKTKPDFEGQIVMPFEPLALYVAFDAKSRAGATLYVTEKHFHQVKRLHDIARFKGIAFLLLENNRAGTYHLAVPDEYWDIPCKFAIKFSDCWPVPLLNGLPDWLVVVKHLMADKVFPANV